jgi:hypothetical protein
MTCTLTDRHHNRLARTLKIMIIHTLHHGLATSLETRPTVIIHTLHHGLATNLGTRPAVIIHTLHHGLATNLETRPTVIIHTLHHGLATSLETRPAVIIHTLHHGLATNLETKGIMRHLALTNLVQMTMGIQTQDKHLSGQSSSQASTLRDRHHNWLTRALKIQAIKRLSGQSSSVTRIASILRANPQQHLSLN